MKPAQNIPPGMDEFAGPPEELPAHWRARAAKLEAWGAPEAAAQFRSAAQELEHVTACWRDAVVTRGQAARECPKITGDYIGKLQKAGTIPDRGAGMLRRGDLHAYLLTGAVPEEARPDIRGLGEREELRLLDHAAGVRTHS